MKNAKKPATLKTLKVRNFETYLLQDLQRVKLKDCVNSPRWVLSVVKDARKALLRYLTSEKVS